MTTSPAPERSGHPESEGAIPRPSPDDPASAAILSSLTRAVHRIQAAEELARQGEPEGVHRLRTSARRLRSELQAFGKLVEADWRMKLAEELKWMGSAIGDVRDLDVLRDRFAGSEAHADHETLKPLFDWLDGRHAKAARTMRRTLKTKRFQALMGSLREGGEAPPLADKAQKPCRKVLPPLVEKAWAKLRSDADALTSDTPDPVFHEVRKRAKRARYTTELIAPTLGKKIEARSQRIIQLATTIQDVLGEHQDAVVAIGEVETFLASGDHDDDFRQAADRLLKRLRRDADESRDDFLERLGPKLDKKRNSGRLDEDL